MRKMLCFIGLALAIGLVSIVPSAAQTYSYVEGWRPSQRFNDSIDLYHHGELIGSFQREGYWVPAGANYSIDVWGLIPDRGHVDRKGVKNFGVDWQGAHQGPMPHEVPKAGERVTINGKPGTIDDALNLLPDKSPTPGPGPCPCPNEPNWLTLGIIAALIGVGIAVLRMLKRRAII